MNNIINEDCTVAVATGSSIGQRLSKVYGPDMMFNASAVRARAGILNIILGTTIFILLGRPELDPVIYVAPFLLLDMVAAVIFGLTPVSPTGIIGTLLTRKTRPVWRGIVSFYLSRHTVA
jgi:hypothetical protein